VHSKRLGRASEPASRHTHSHTRIQAVSSSIASKRTTNTTTTPQRCCTAAVSRYSVQSPPPLRTPPYACIRPASQCPSVPARIVPTEAQTRLCGGATFYNGNSRPYFAPHFAAERRTFCRSPTLRRRETFDPFPTPRQTWKSEVGRKIRRRRLRVCVECVRACVAAKIYRTANCTPSTAARGSARDVTSPTTAALFNCSVFHIPPSEPHSDYL